MRYAVYFMPPAESALWTFGSGVLGYDAFAGAEAAHPALPEASPAEISQWTQEPRRYGFHATLKAPFELAESTGEQELIEACEEFARRQRGFALTACRIAALGRFLALIPAQASAPLQALAAACVMDFDRFRAPLSAFDRARRQAQPLGERLAAQMERWGYPYIFDDFQFHLTLSGPLEAQERAVFLAALQRLYAPLDKPLPIDAIALFRQPGREAPFHVLRRFGFGI